MEGSTGKGIRQKSKKEVFEMGEGRGIIRRG